MGIQGSKLSRLLVDDLFQMRAKGYSIRRIAVELNLSTRTVQKYVRLFGDERTIDHLNEEAEDLSGGSETLVN